MWKSEQLSGERVSSSKRVGVLLIHGLCGSPAEIRYIASGLGREGVKVVCPTLAGYSGSGDEVKASSWHDWYRSAEEALDELARTCDRVVVGGLSTGAVLGLLLAAKKPDKVHGLALYSPTLWLSGRSVPWYLRLFRFVNNKRVADMFRFPFPAHVGIKDQRIRDFVQSAASAGSSGMPSTPGCVVVERRRLCKEAMSTLNQITQPVLILHAREDDYAGLDNAAHLQQSLAGPVDLVVLEDSYHMVTIDRQRNVVLDRTVGFISRLGGALEHATVGAASAKAPRAVGLA